MSALMLDLFEQTAARFPARRAIADEEGALTFLQLQNLARQLAALFAEEGTCVGIMAHRDRYTVALFLAAAYAGKCYIPLDPEQPEQKRRAIVDNAGVKEILTVHPADQEQVRGPLRVLDLALTDPHRPTDRPLEEKANEALYIVYTSGSTGTPKGVLKSHSAMHSFITAYLAEFAFDEQTVIGNQTPFYFDASAKDIYLMAACGAALEILPTRHFSFPVNLVNYMNERRVNFISWVPSALTLVTTLNTFLAAKPLYLKRVAFVGEVFAPKHLNKWMEALPEVEFVNLYGSSEICGISCFCRINQPADPATALPIGGPLANCRIALVEDGQTSPACGELYVASPALADGYFNDPQRTAAQFVVADLGDGPLRYYRTGDIVGYNDRGQLVFIGRRDHQIKHMGHRIELGEIEAAATALDGIEKCCCVYDAKRSKIVLFLQPCDGVSPDLAVIRAGLKEKLSDYMLPQRIKVLPRLPLNANGKIHRTALQEQL